jgi:ubiquinone/menaquinone biosynthesis C-methylase UbiE
MSKPVDKVEFWKERVETAVKPHYSVYVVHEAGWKRINDVHQSLFNKYIPKDAKVLDAGCGYGRWSSHFENYVGVDFSPDFIEWAKKDNPGTDFIQADLKALPFADKEFDWAFCVSIKRMIQANLGNEAWDAMEKELLRVAKKVLILEYEDPYEHSILG